jgi:putative ABC transport system substrate-binding protein
VVGKRLEFLLQLAPQVKRLYIPYDVNYPLNPAQLEALRSAAKGAGLTLVEAPVTGLADLQADLQARAKSGDIGMDAIMVFSEIMATSKDGFAAINEFAVQHHLPIAGSASTTADRGAVFSYSANTLELGQLAAPLANKILKGTQAGTIPVVSPEPSAAQLQGGSTTGLTVPKFIEAASEIIR